jgi:GR25 family glycosyltransferase involved in LPS biosynthesis
MLKHCYYINLDKRTDRKEHIEKELSKSEQLQQIYQRFPAVDGTLIHPRDVREGLLTENAICDILASKISAWGLSLTQGGLGVLLSYLALFDEISKLDSPAIIFEDDSVLVDNFDEKLAKITSQLPDDFDICYLGYADMPIQKEYYSEDLSIPKGMIVCLPSIIVSPVGAEKLLNLLNNIDNQVDTAIYHHLDKLNAFVSNEKIVNIPNEMGTDIQGNINCSKKYKTQNYIIATLAHGDFPNDNVVRLARDLRYFDQKLLVVTNKPELFETLENVIVVKYPNKRFSYNDKIICFEEGFKLADAVVYVDSDTRIFYENYKHTYGNFLRIIENGFHPSWDWGKITRSDNNRFFNSTDVTNRVAGYGELALDICKQNGIDYDQAFHYQEGMLIMAKDNGKEQLFLDMWKYFADKLDNFEEKSNSPRIGVGEGIEDFKPFNSNEFAKALFSRT